MILHAISAPANINVHNCSFKRSIAVAAKLSGCPGNGTRRVATTAAANPSKTKDNDTVFALSTAPGRAAIAIVRLTGPDCGALVRLSETDLYQLLLVHRNRRVGDPTSQIVR